jgi:hypothetical protein
MKGLESFVDSPDQRTFTSNVNGALLLILCLHICGFFSAGFRETRYNYFGHLGRSFFQGRLDTPQLGGKLDVSTYQNKTYLYWGPAGGVVFAIGNLVYDGVISDRVVAAVLLAMNFYLWFWIVSEFCPPGRVANREFLVLLTFAWLGGLFVTQFKTPWVWQMGHIIAYTGMSLAVYGLVARKLRVNLAVAGFCLALASRQSMILLAPGLAVLAFVLLQRERGDFKKAAHAMLAPVSIVVGTLVMLAMYNYLRFDSFVEFGQAYKSDIAFYAEQTKLYGTVSLHHLPRNAWIYFVEPIGFSSTYPYLTFDSRGNAIWSYHPAIYLPLAFTLSGGFSREPARIQQQRSETRQEFRSNEKTNLLSSSATANQTERLRTVMMWLAGSWCLYLAFLCCLVWTGSHTFGGRYLCDVEPFLLATTLYAYVQVRDSGLLRSVSLAVLVVSIGIKLLYIL